MLGYTAVSGQHRVEKRKWSLKRITGQQQSIVCKTELMEGYYNA